MILARPIAWSAAAVLLSAVSVTGVRAEDAPTAKAPHLARTFAIPDLPAVDPELGVSLGRFDHLAYDPKTKRLWVAAIGHRSIEVIDLERGVHVKSLGGLGHPAGVVLIPSSGRMVATCASDGHVVAFDATTLAEVGRARVGDEPDNIRFVGERIHVAYGSDEAGGIATLDPQTLVKVSEVPIAGHPESFQLTPDAKRVFVNLPHGDDADGQVVVGDVAGAKVEATWTLPKLLRNYPMALDAEGKRLFIGSRKPARLTCVDTTTGKVMSSVPCGEDVDDLFHDAKSQTVLVISGGGAEGSLETFAVDAAGTLKRSTSVATPSGSRTGLYVPERGAVYVAVPRREGRVPEIREYLLPR